MSAGARSALRAFRNGNIGKVVVTSALALVAFGHRAHLARQTNAHHFGVDGKEHKIRERHATFTNPRPELMRL